MSEANKPAFPTTALTAVCNCVTATADHPGLTKREHFAGLAMQAYLGRDTRAFRGEDAAHWAVRAADCLIAELAKEPVRKGEPK